MMSSGRYTPYSPARSAPHSPHVAAARGGGGMRGASSLLTDQELYLSELLQERNKITPFVVVLPNSYRLLNQEILRVTTLLENASVFEQNVLEQAIPLASGGMHSNGGANNLWTSPFHSEMPGLMHPSPTQSGLGSSGSPSGRVVKQMFRINVPVEQYPNYDFVGRLLGPRGDFLKQVEATTGCRVLVRGRGSIKDPEMEATMMGKPGYEHLNEALHVLIEAELPVEIIDARVRQAREILEDLLQPKGDTQDYYRQQQLRELALFDGTRKEEVSPMSVSVSPFSSSLGMKRAKTGGE